MLVLFNNWADGESFDNEESASNSPSSILESGIIMWYEIVIAVVGDNNVAFPRRLGKFGLECTGKRKFGDPCSSQASRMSMCLVQLLRLALSGMTETTRNDWKRD